MTGRVDQTAAWIYSGVWRSVVEWLRVPPAPTLPDRSPEGVRVFHPAPGFLKYLKFWFWIVLTLVDGMIAVGWVAVMAFNVILGVALLPVFLFVAVAPDIIAYIAIHLRYDTTWYVMSDRAMHLRRGVWTITEVTITYENVQNVKIKSGPVQRGFQIKDVIVETAGSGAGDSQQGQPRVTNRGLIEGVANAEEIRDLIMRRVRASRSAGLGDEHDVRAGAGVRWTPEHIAALREIRDATLELGAG